jgi:hypothetical protein
VKTARQIIALSIGIILMGSGCASLRPPAEDKVDWERQQKQQEETASSSSDLLNNPLFYWSVWLAAMGVGVATTHQVVSLPPPDNSTSNQSPSP